MKNETKASHEVNYTLFHQKLTFDFLKAHLWKAADILRGSLDRSEDRQPVMTLLFLKRLNDTFEETTLYIPVFYVASHYLYGSIRGHISETCVKDD